MRTLRYGLSEESVDLLLTFLIHMHAPNRQTAVISSRSNSTICYRIVIGWLYVRRCYPVFLCTKMGRNKYGYPPKKSQPKHRYFSIRTRIRVAHICYLLTIILSAHHHPMSTTRPDTNIICGSNVAVVTYSAELWLAVVQSKTFA